MTTYSYTGLLSQTYKPGKPAPSALHTPAFSDVLDFDSYRRLGRESWPRSFVTYERKYELLSEIVALLRAETGAACAEIIAYSRMPSIMRMPPELFGDDLFFVTDPDGESDRIAAQGISHLVLRDGFLRHSLEDGDNRLTLRWRLAPADADQIMARVAAGLERLGIAEQHSGWAQESAA